MALSNAFPLFTVVTVGGVNEDKVVRHIKIRLALNRFECLRARDSYASKQRMPGNDRDHGIDTKLDIPLNSRLFSKRGITNARELWSEPQN